MLGRELDVVAVDVAQLEQQVREMSTHDAPGREFCDAIAELARTGRFEKLRPVLPALVYEELGERYAANPEAFIAGWRELARDMREGFIQHARQRLTLLTHMLRRGNSGESPAWQEIQRALDSQENELLRTAFA